MPSLLIAGNGGPSRIAADAARRAALRYRALCGFASRWMCGGAGGRRRPRRLAAARVQPHRLVDAGAGFRIRRHPEVARHPADAGVVRGRGQGARALVAAQQRLHVARAAGDRLLGGERIGHAVVLRHLRYRLHHALRALRRDRGGIEAALGMRDRARPHAIAWGARATAARRPLTPTQAGAAYGAQAASFWSAYHSARRARS
jgi:hypothetical protein